MVIFPGLESSYIKAVTRHINLYLLLTFLLSTLISQTLFANTEVDIVYLRKGGIITGKFVSNTDSHIFIKDSTGRVKRFNYNRVERMYLGYGGLLLCYSINGAPDVRNCSGRLLYIKAEEAGLIGKTGNIQLALDKVNFLSFKKASPDERILPVLRKHVYLKFILRDGSSVFGRIEAIKNSLVTLRLKNKRLRTLRESELVSGMFIPLQKKQVTFKDARILLEKRSARKSERGGAYVWKAWFLIPALPQIYGGRKWKGAAIIGGLVLLAGAGASEFRQTRIASQASRQDFATRFFNEQKYTRRYRRHLDNQRAASVGAVLLYLYHLADILWLDRSLDLPRSRAGLFTRIQFVSVGVKSGLRVKLSFQY